MTPEEYEAKRQARIDRLRRAAERSEQASQSSFLTADKMASVIPFGQPILVGHHSETADRRYRDRIHANMRKGMVQKAEAADYARRAEAAEKNRAIFSDDPEASEKIEAKITRLQSRQDLMKKANRLVRKEDKDGLAALGFSEQVISQLFSPDFAGRLGFPGYELRNNGANIRRLKKRLTHLQAHADDETTEDQIGSVRIVDNTDANRVQIFFPGKPNSTIRSRLKSNGFRWARSAGCWQRHRSDWALQLAREIAKEA